MRGSRADLRRMLESGVQALGFELVAVELTGGGHHATLRVYIDRPGGVSVEHCADVSRQLSAILDVEDPIAGEYTLEVSSPGLDRPLVTPEHFRRFTGERIKVRLLHPVQGRRNIIGRLAEAGDDRVVVETDAAGGGQERLTLRYADIERARLAPKF